jgi:integrase
MASFKFYLLNARKDGKLVKKELSIYLFVNHNGKRWYFKIDERIEPKYWSFRDGEVKGTYKRGVIEINESLETIKVRVRDEYRKKAGIVPDGPLKQLLEAAVRGDSDSSTELTVLDVMNRFLESQKGTLRDSTIRAYKSKLVSRFEERYPTLRFEEVDLRFLDKYKSWMISERMLNATISKAITILCTFMEWAQIRGYHSNMIYKSFSGPRLEKKDIITHSEEEIKAIARLEGLNDKFEKVRDLYLFQIYTGQRFSDVQAFDKKDLKGNFWVFVQGKTGKQVTVPLLGWSAPALAILEKYDFHLPKISNQKFNDYIKEIGELAEIDQVIEVKQKSGVTEIVSSEPKYTFMSSHTARRTTVTYLLEQGVPPTTIMKMTGHSDLKTLQKYENTSVEALAKALEGLQ